jgi:hypothetical protein
MRSFISKVVTGSMIAGAALAIAACTPKTETTTDNSVVDMNSEMTTDTTTDNMTAVDTATGDNAMVANETETTTNTVTENKM